MATSFLDKTGLGTFWAKIKSTFALKSEIPDSTSDLTNDSGFITDAGVTSFNGAIGAVTYSAKYLINLTESNDAYTADKTYQQITAAITEGKIPYVTYDQLLYKYAGTYGNDHGFETQTFSNLIDQQGNVIMSFQTNTILVVDSTNTWEKYDSSITLPNIDENGNETLAGKLTVGAAPTANMDVATKQYVDNAVSGSGITYALSISGNVITLTGSSGSPSSVTLPVYNGGVSS